jgi:hypothetical protein
MTVLPFQIPGATVRRTVMGRGGGRGISIGALSNEYRIVGEIEVWELQWNVLKQWTPKILLLRLRLHGFLAAPL